MPHRPTLVRVRFDDDRWPHIAAHIRFAKRLRKSGRLRYPRVFHIDRAGADENRRQALQGIPTRSGYDRDEYPPAVAREGGKGADVRYVRSSENRSAGAYMGNKLGPTAQSSGSACWPCADSQRIPCGILRGRSRRRTWR